MLKTSHFCPRCASGEAITNCTWNLYERLGQYESSRKTHDLNCFLLQWRRDSSSNVTSARFLCWYHDNTAEGNAWSIIKYHQLDGMACFCLPFFRLFFSCLKLEHSRHKHTPVTHRKSLDATVPWVEFAVGMDPLIVAWALGTKTQQMAWKSPHIHRRYLHVSQIQPVFLGGWKFCRFGLRQTQQLAFFFSLWDENCGGFSFLC